VQIADGGSSTYFLTTFGRATRETVCSCEVKMEPTLSQALHLLNGNTVNGKIRQGGLIARLIATRKFPEERNPRPLRPLLFAQADQGRAREAPAGPRRGLEPGAGPRGHLLGPAQQPRVPVQTIEP